MRHASYLLVILTAVLVFVVFGIFLLERSRPENKFGYADKIQSLHVALANLQLEIDAIHNQNEFNNVSVFSSQPIWRLENKVTSRQEQTQRDAASLTDSTLQRKENKQERSVEANISKRAVIFTMDSIGSYEKNSLSGGAAGTSTDLLQHPRQNNSIMHSEFRSQVN